MKVVLHSCGPEPTRLARLVAAKAALEAAGHEAQIWTTGVGMPRTAWTDCPSFMALSFSRITDRLRADIGKPIYAGKMGQKRTELLALFSSLGISVAQAAIINSVEELQAKLAQFGDVAVIVKRQEFIRVSDLRETRHRMRRSGSPPSKSFDWRRTGTG